jgi:hypothetical protein
LARARVSALANAGQDTRAIQTWCATPNSHRPVQKLLAPIGNPRSSQQLMGQLPICCCSKAKKFNDFSRAGVGLQPSRTKAKSRARTHDRAAAIGETPDRIPSYSNSGWGACATLNSTSQQLMGQLPICCCRKAKKFNDFSRACGCALRVAVLWVAGRGSNA